MKLYRYGIKNTGLTVIATLGLTTVSWAGGWGLMANMTPEPRPDYAVIQVLNQDQFEGNWKQLKGALKEQWGEFTDDDLLEIEGKLDRFEGKAQERYGDRKAEVREWVDQWLEQHQFEAQSKSE